MLENIGSVLMMSGYVTAAKRPAAAARHIKIWIVTVFMLFVFACSVQAKTPVRFYAKVKTPKLLVGEQTTVKTKGKNTVYKFKSSNKNVFKVNKKGVIKAVGKGKATITIRGTYKPEDGEKQTFQKKVRIKVYGCGISKTELNIKCGQTAALKIKGNKLGRTVRWRSSAPQVAGVDANGVVTGKTEGTANVAAKVGKYIVLQCSVSVTRTFLGTAYETLMVNDSYRYGTLDLKAQFGKVAASDNVTLQYTMSSSNLGRISGNIYYAGAGGTNTISVYSDLYQFDVVIKQYVWQAHRGYLDIRPENTMDAFMAAVIHGARFIETDIRFTSDGVPVLFHDSKVDGMTNGTGKLSAFTFEEVQKLQIDTGNHLEMCNDRRIPTLKEFLELCKRYNIIANLELKTLGNESQRAGYAQEIYREIVEAGMVGRVYMTSFYPELLVVFRENSTERIPIAANGTTAPATLASYNLPNSSLPKNTIFGSYSILDYSPEIGRLGKSTTEYRSS